MNRQYGELDGHQHQHFEAGEIDTATFHVVNQTTWCCHQYINRL